MWDELFVVQIFTACHWLGLNPILFLCTYLCNYKKFNYLVVNIWLQISFFWLYVTTEAWYIYSTKKMSFWHLFLFTFYDCYTCELNIKRSNFSKAAWSNNSEVWTLLISVDKIWNLMMIILIIGSVLVYNKLILTEHGNVLIVLKLSYK